MTYKAINERGLEEDRASVREREREKEREMGCLWNVVCVGQPAQQG